jgi:hypothetical protein
MTSIIPDFDHTFLSFQLPFLFHIQCYNPMLNLVVIGCGNGKLKRLELSQG